eukprot:gene2235-5244_t
MSRGLVALILVVLVAVGLKIALDYTALPAKVPDDLPHEMRAIRVHGINNVTVDTVPVPKVESGHVLIKVKAAALNPSDVYFLRGIYSTDGNDSTFPLTGGFEGSGVIVGHGGGAIGQLLLHQRVAFATMQGGAYGEYVVVPMTNILPLPATQHYDKGAFSLVNPLTAVGMVSTAIGDGHSAIVQNAAASALGKMFVKLCHLKGIPLVNIVRRIEQKEQLVDIGASPEHVLISSDPNFLNQLKKISHELGTTAAFDAIAGPATSELLGAMPPGTAIYVYGILSNQNLDNIHPGDLMQHRKSIRGWHLRVWQESLSLPMLALHIYQVGEPVFFTQRTRELLTTALTTEVRARVTFDTFVNAIDALHGNCHEFPPTSRNHKDHYVRGK